MLDLKPGDELWVSVDSETLAAPEPADPAPAGEPPEPVAAEPEAEPARPYQMLSHLRVDPDGSYRVVS